MVRYQVTAPYVTVRTVTERGPQVVGLLKDSWVPQDAPAEWIERHLRKGMIAPVGGQAPARPKPKPEPERGGAAASSGDTPAPAGGLQPPPTTGPGSGREAWIDYAVARGMDRDEAAAMRRDDLIARLQGV